MPYEITITEVKETSESSIRIKRLEMTLDELDIQSVIKQITAPKRKRNAKKAAA